MDKYILFRVYSKIRNTKIVISQFLTAIKELKDCDNVPIII